MPSLLQFVPALFPFQTTSTQLTNFNLKSLESIKSQDVIPVYFFCFVFRI